MKTALPPIVVYKPHRRFLPRGLARCAVQEIGRQHFVAVREDIRLDDDSVAQNTFDGESTGVNFRLYGFDHHAA